MPRHHDGERCLEQVKPVTNSPLVLDRRHQASQCHRCPDQRKKDKHEDIAVDKREREVIIEREKRSKEGDSPTARVGIETLDAEGFPAFWTANERGVMRKTNLNIASGTIAEHLYHESCLVRSLSHRSKQFLLPNHA